MLLSPSSSFPTLLLATVIQKVWLALHNAVSPHLSGRTQENQSVHMASQLRFKPGTSEMRSKRSNYEPELSVSYLLLLTYLLFEHA